MVVLRVGAGQVVAGPEAAAEAYLYAAVRRARKRQYHRTAAIHIPLRLPARC